MPAYWELIAGALTERGWSYGIKAGLSQDGRRVFILDAHRDDGHWYIVTAGTLLTAFLELRAVTRAVGTGG